MNTNDTQAKDEGHGIEATCECSSAKYSRRRGRRWRWFTRWRRRSPTRLTLALTRTITRSPIARRDLLLAIVLSILLLLACLPIFELLRIDIVAERSPVRLRV